MVQILVLSHGRLAEVLLESARRIAGEAPALTALCLDWSSPREELAERIHREVEALDAGDGVLVLTDLAGDTPSNLVEDLARPGRLEVVSGVNLPMVLRLSCLGSREMPLAELATWITDKGRQSIRHIGELLEACS